MKTKWTAVVGVALCAAVSLISINSQASPLTGGQDVNGTVSRGDRTQTVRSATGIKPFVMFPVTNSVVPDVIMYIGAYLGPLPSNTDAYNAWGTNLVWSAYHSGTPLSIVGRPSGELGWTLDPHYLIQTADLTNNSLWFVIHVVSTSPAYKFSPSQLTFVEFSNDSSNDSLGKTNPLDNASYVYSPYGMGVNWSSGGPRVSDQFVTSGFWNTNTVNEFIFVGAASTYYLASYNAVTNYLDSFATNGFNSILVKGSWVFQEGTNSFWCNKTLHIQGSSIGAIPSCSLNIPPTTVVVGANEDANDTWILQTTLDLQPPVWNDLTFMNANDQSVMPQTNGMQYFRLEKE